MSDGGPVDGRSDPAGVPRPLLPLVWVAAASWVVLRATGRGFGTLHDWYIRGWAAAGRAALRAGRTVLTWSGPLGRGLLRFATPLARAVKRGWDRVGLRVVLFLVRPLGRCARWLAAATHRVADRVVRQARRLAAQAEPVLRPLSTVTAAVARTASRIAAFSRGVLGTRRPVRRPGRSGRDQSGRTSSRSSQRARSVISRSTAVVIAVLNGTSRCTAATRSSPSLRSAVALSFPTSRSPYRIGRA